MNKVNKLVKAVDTHHSDGFKGIFYSLMVSVQWYPGRQQQKAARRARARLNGALVKNAKYQGHTSLDMMGYRHKKDKDCMTCRIQLTYKLLGTICLW